MKMNSAVTFKGYWILPLFIYCFEALAIYSFLLHFICLVLFSCGNSTYQPEEYISTNLTEEKIDLSKEVFKKLKKEHYIKNFVKDDFNINYINALIERLDENKLYFLESEIKNFKEESSQYSGKSFDIDLAYLIINLYFERLVDFSEFQIKPGTIFQTLEFFLPGLMLSVSITWVTCSCRCLRLL